jgi:hypothetical protein
MLSHLSNRRISPFECKSLGYIQSTNISFCQWFGKQPFFVVRAFPLPDQQNYTYILFEILLSF